jgi:predicted lipid-binding transport protein (Tim44 family)
VPVEFSIVIFAVIAAVVLFQLYNVLGKKVGRQPEDGSKVPVLAKAPATPEPVAKLPAVDAAALAAAASLRARDPGFDPAKFIEGARQAYETIVRSYHAGDRAALKPLLSPTVLESFEAGITARETRGEREEVEFLQGPRADLEIASAEGDKAVAKVRFLAELRSKVFPADMEAVAEPRVEERRTAEHWTFERSLGTTDPNWVLARVEPASA